MIAVCGHCKAELPIDLVALARHAAEGVGRLVAAAGRGRRVKETAVRLDAAGEKLKIEIEGMVLSWVN